MKKLILSLCFSILLFGCESEESDVYENDINILHTKHRGEKIIDVVDKWDRVAFITQDTNTKLITSISVKWEFRSAYKKGDVIK